MIWEKLKQFFESAHAQKGVFEPRWIEYLDANIPLYRRLPQDLKERLHEKIGVFVSNTFFEACNGLELDEEMILTVAGQACLLVVNREGDPYRALRTVLLYPTTFSSVQKNRDDIGIVSEGVVHRLGESWGNGTLVLAWDSVAGGARNIHDGHNVALHEFAHQLDSADGSTDGAPAMASRHEYREWARVMKADYLDFIAKLERGEHTVIDPYGATNPAEFFAVITETFFEKPRQLAAKHPALYEQLKSYYMLDPAEWFHSH